MSIINRNGAMLLSLETKLIIIAMLIQLHALDGSLIEVNPDAIASLRGRSTHDGHLHKDVNCLVNTTDGLHISVKETCGEVLREIAKEKAK
jgi:hypothetical protein